MVFTTLFIFPACMTELMTQLEYLSIAGDHEMYLSTAAVVPRACLNAADCMRCMVLRTEAPCGLAQALCLC